MYRYLVLVTAFLLIISLSVAAPKPIVIPTKAKEVKISIRWTIELQPDDEAIAAYQEQKARTAVIDFARAQLGKEYVLWGDSINTWDCSGLVQSAYIYAAGIQSPHNSELQADIGRQITREELEPGDLIIWDYPYDEGFHISIYTGEGTQISAYNEQRGVVEDPMDVWPDGVSVRFYTWLG